MIEQFEETTLNRFHKKSGNNISVRASNKGQPTHYSSIRAWETGFGYLLFSGVFDPLDVSAGRGGRLPPGSGCHGLLCVEALRGTAGIPGKDFQSQDGQYTMGHYGVSCRWGLDKAAGCPAEPSFSRSGGRGIFCSAAAGK